MSEEKTPLLTRISKELATLMDGHANREHVVLPFLHQLVAELPEEDRIEALERENAALRDDDAKMQLLHRQEDQLIAAERKLIAAEADKARLSEALRPFALISSEGVVKAAQGHVTITTSAEYFHRACAALSGSGSGWRAMDSAPETGFFLAWSPDFPDMVSCWKAELFHQARKPGTPRHLSANHFTLWRPLDLPSAPQQGGE